MAVRILTSEDGEQVLYCSTTMQAFGPVHENIEYDLEDFLEWLPKDARTYGQDELTDLYHSWFTECELNDLTGV